MYGESHIKIIEKCSNHPHIRALKNASPDWCSITAFNPSVFTPGTGITDKNLYTSTSNKTAIIFFLKLGVENIDFIWFKIMVYLLNSKIRYIIIKNRKSKAKVGKLHKKSLEKLSRLFFNYTNSTEPQAFLIFSWAEAVTLSTFKVIFDVISPSPKTLTL